MKRARFLTVFLIQMLIISTATFLQADWSLPERITFNNSEDRTNAGSVAIDGNDLLHVTWNRMRPDSGGTQVLYMEGRGGEWGEIVALTPADRVCYKPDIAVHTNGSSHIVWLDKTGDWEEVYYATDASGSWVTEQVTFNETSKVHPVIAVDGDNIPHAAWAGWDPQSGEGKIFYGNRSSGSWEIEVLADSYIGDYWTGATPSISVSQTGIVQIAYRGGNYEDYHIHQATNVTGRWVIQQLSSGNMLDYTSSVRTDYYGKCFLAICGNDGWWTPYSVYYTESMDGGVTWSPTELATGAYDAMNSVLGVDWYGGAQMAWEENSGTMATGTIFFTTNQGGLWTSEQITGSEENFYPSIAVDGSGAAHAIYVNTRRLQSDSTEVFYLTNSAPVVTISMVPLGETVIPRGAILEFDLTVTNETSSPVTGDLWFTGIVAETGAEFRIPPALLNIPNPLSGIIPAGRTFQKTIRIKIPPLAPTGLFTIAGSVGDYWEKTYMDRAAVSVRIVP